MSESDSASVITVHVDTKFTDRVAFFNVQLQQLRHQLLLTLHRANVCNVTRWISARNNLSVGRRRATPLRVVWGVEENYIDKLSDNPDIITVVLPWLGSRSNWNSLTDFSNVPHQRYFEWSADDVLCTWIETPGVIKMRYDTVYRRTCNRNVQQERQRYCDGTVTATAVPQRQTGQPQSLLAEQRELVPRPFLHLDASLCLLRARSSKRDCYSAW